VFGTLELAQIGASNQYQFSSSGGRTVYDDIHDLFLAERGGVVGITSLSSGFFPLETQPRSKVCNIWPYWRFAATGACQAGASLTVPEQWDPRGWYGSNLTPPAMITGGPAGTLAPIMGERRNFYFTSEARYLFRYAGGETLAFFGDDDVWVYINGRLVLDLGAPHERLQGQITLTATGASYTISAQNVVTGAAIPVDTGTVPNLGLVAGNTYEIAVFHADRHPRESNYQLTLSGFSTTRSICQPQCGDGATTAGEECDDGATNQDDVYGGCTTQCKFGPFCGDGVMNGPEECDAGRENTALYGTPGGCTSACTRSHFCGDGHVDTAFMEQCDSGTPEGNGVCTAECRLGVQ
jgi:fibro-slime domain-containing protein